MLTRKHTEPSGIESTAPYFNFFARVYQDERGVLKAAQAKARERLGDTPSNGVLLVEVLRAYVGEDAR